MNIDPGLIEAVRERRAILFAGAGVSQNLGLPSFTGLVERLAHELDYDPELFQTHGDYLALAEFYYLRRGNLDALLQWMRNTWEKNVDLKNSEVHRLIVDLVFRKIYTKHKRALPPLPTEPTMDGCVAGERSTRRIHFPDSPESRAGGNP